ncbi:MAG TPA: hypothetical protein VK879_17955 [Candidatus Sulfomarinibacteraceae bacterium]|nr:hypothetical protein [Candidatus Sulfomarinibacteraceae bacterium]
MDQSRLSNRSNQTVHKEGQNAPISAELVRRVSDRVYELWRDDLRLERERRRISRKRWQRR